MANDDQAARKDAMCLVQDHWTLPPNSCDLLKRVGGGRYGQLWAAKLFTGSKGQVAVEKIKRDLQVGEMETEIAMMKSLRHPNIIKLIGISSGSSTIEIVSEYCPHGSIANYCKKQSLTPEQQLSVVTLVAKAMEYLSQEAVLGLLTAETVLLAADFTPRISDFSLATRTEHMEGRTASPPPPHAWRWAAPELLPYNELGFSTQSDVWCYGVFVWELYSDCALPYKDIENSSNLHKFLVRQLRLPVGSTWPDSIQLVLDQCWEGGPEKRPPFTQLLQTF